MRKKKMRECMNEEESSKFKVQSSEKDSEPGTQNWKLETRN
jgi:hypothetical protein